MNQRNQIFKAMYNEAIAVWRSTPYAVEHIFERKMPQADAGSVVNYIFKMLSLGDDSTTMVSRTTENGSTLVATFGFYEVAPLTISIPLSA